MLKDFLREVQKNQAETQEIQEEPKKTILVKQTTSQSLSSLTGGLNLSELF